MPKVEITRQGTRSVDINELMQTEVVKQTLKFAAREFEGLPGPRGKVTVTVQGDGNSARVQPPPPTPPEQREE